MHRLRLAFALLALLSLGSCSRVFTVTASFAGGQLTFLSEDDEETFAPWCWYDFWVVDDQGRAVWNFNAYDAYRNATRCGPNFPLVYGREPTGAEVLQPPQKLRVGQLYYIGGDAAGMLKGAFILYRAAGKLVIRNVDPNSAQAQAVRNLHFEDQARRRGEGERAVTE